MLAEGGHLECGIWPFQCLFLVALWPANTSILGEKIVLLLSDSCRATSPSKWTAYYRHFIHLTSENQEDLICTSQVKWWHSNLHHYPLSKYTYSFLPFLSHQILLNTLLDSNSSFNSLSSSTSTFFNQLYNLSLEPNFIAKSNPTIPPSEVLLGNNVRTLLLPFPRTQNKQFWVL